MYIYIYIFVLYTHINTNFNFSGPTFTLTSQDLPPEASWKKHHRFQSLHRFGAFYRGSVFHAFGVLQRLASNVVPRVAQRWAFRRLQQQVLLAQQEAQKAERWEVHWWNFVGMEGVMMMMMMMMMINKTKHKENWSQMRMTDTPKMMLVDIFYVLSWIVRCWDSKQFMYVRYFSFVSFISLLITSIKTMKFLVSMVVLMGVFLHELRVQDMRRVLFFNSADKARIIALAELAEPSLFQPQVTWWLAIRKSNHHWKHTFKRLNSQATSNQPPNGPNTTLPPTIMNMKTMKPGNFSQE